MVAAPLLATRQGLAGIGPAPGAAQIGALKTAVLGPNGALLATWIGRAASAYTDASFAGNDQWQGGAGPGGGAAGNVIRSEGFTPVAGVLPGAVYEFREPEIGRNRPGGIYGVA